MTEGEALEQAAIESWREERLRELLREHLGFCTMVKESTVPGAGAGLFVEGFAPEGAVVAIYPVSFECAYSTTGGEGRRRTT